MRQYTFPLFGTSGLEYSRTEAAQQANSFNMLLQRLLSAGPWRATTLTLTAMQQGDNGLEAGTLFLDGNVVKIPSTPVEPGMEVKHDRGRKTVKKAPENYHNKASFKHSEKPPFEIVFEVLNVWH